MSTRAIFTPELLDRCISCGFCLPACPTYARTGVETSSPRGRIDLMRALESGELPDDDATVQEESSFCLGCRACEPVCPAGLELRRLLAPLLWGANRSWRVRALGLMRRHARRRRVGDGPQLMLGCYERALFPRVSRSARRLVPELRVDPGQGCCGALHAHNGNSARGRELAEELGHRLDGMIVTTAGGCAAHLASVLGRDRVRELSQLLAGDAPRAPAPAGGGPRPRIALQDSCHLRNGLGVFREPRELIDRVGEYVELPSAAECCGAAGTYSLLRPRDSRRILDGKLDEIEAAGVDLVVAVNPGCLRQLRTGLRRRRSTVRAVHLADLLADDHHHHGAT